MRDSLLLVTNAAMVKEFPVTIKSDVATNAMVHKTVAVDAIADLIK